MPRRINESDYWKATFAGRRKRKTKYRTYDMSLNEIVELHKSQHGKCANPGCRAVIQVYGRLRAVDRDPQTGKPRGMLCKQCCLGLGMFQDNPRRIAGILIYLMQRNKMSNSK